MATTREILAGRAAVELSIRDKLKAGLDGAQQRLQRFAVSVAAIGISFQTVQAMASSAMGIIANVFTGPGDQIQDLSERTGLSAAMLQTLAEAAADTGGTLQDVGGAARAMANFLQQAERGGSGAADTLSDLGISAAELAGMSQDQRLQRFADALGGIEDPARRSALAQDVFGRGAVNLIPLLAGGSAAMEAYRKRLQEIGALRTDEQIAAAAKLSDSFGRLKRRLEAIGFSALSAMAPVLQKISDAAVGVLEVFNRWVVQNPILAQTLGLVTIGAITAAVALATLTGVTLAASAMAYAASVAWGVATAAVGVFSAVMAVLATPLGLFIALAAALLISLAALGAALLLTTESGQLMVTGFMAGLKTLLDFAKQVFGGIFDALAAGNLGLAGDIVMAGLAMAWTKGFGELKRITAESIAAIHVMFLKGVEGLNIPILTGAARTLRAGVEMGAQSIAGDTARELKERADALQELTDQAAKERQAREDALKVPKIGGDDDDREKDKKKERDIAQHLSKQIGSGTFSASAVGGLAQSTRTEKIWGDMVDLQRLAEEHLRDIAEALEDGEPIEVGA